jgi:exonuclease III
MKIHLLQYNVQKSKDGVMIPIIDGKHHFDIISIQEPWINSTQSTTYCPRSSPYHLIFPTEGRARTCIYINKKIPISQWQAGTSPDYCWVRITTPTGQLITIHNIYSPSPRSFTTRLWDTPIPQLQQTLELPGSHLITGDFNLHHPVWGGDNVHQYHQGADLLLHIITQYQLNLSLPPGTITREKGEEHSTLDLSLYTSNLNSKINSYITTEFSGSDHLPIITTINLQQEQEYSSQGQKCWKKINYQALELETSNLLPPTSLETIEQVDNYIHYLTTFIQNLIHQTVPTARISKHSKLWWNEEVGNAIKEERRARRRWNTYHSEESWNNFQISTQLKKKLITKAKQAHWRQGLHEASISPEGIWKLVKWAHTKSYKPPQSVKMPDIQYSQGLATTNEEKADALRQRFYPIVQANLEDIQGPQEQVTELLLDQEATQEEIQKILSKVKPDKCPGADGIPYRILKAMGQPLVIVLAQLITSC